LYKGKGQGTIAQKKKIEKLSDSEWKKKKEKENVRGNEK